ncbi:Tiny macrocysts protein B [Hondaea fermentalgiana]|uniref:Tiny macrocysts protein B n=1 Tax=Hondaea fermentalgiana TaxID=2315210 RepID=A0A2R5G4L6_9STRA|nr:Tiny macrocysts protein B [Hondaea fermentalgiana]|eukprot:GBG25259.1 Tiny macrocysts protein B [Hondaea fermentalgiana]
MRQSSGNLPEHDEPKGFAATRMGRRLSRVLGFMKQGVFGLLYLIAKDQHSSNSVVVATTAVNTLQLLFMSFSERARFPWHWWLSKYLRPFLKFFSLAFVQDLSKPVQMVSFFIFFMMLFSTSAMAALVQSEFASGGVKNLWVLPVLRFMLRLLTTVFYVPVITVLLESLSCDNPFDNILVCGTVAHNAFSAVILGLLLWFITFSGFIVLVFGQRDPSVGDAEAGPHKRLEFVNSLIRALLEFCFQGLAATQNSLTNPNVPVLIFIVNITGFWLTCSYVYYLPYYSAFTNRIMASFYAAFWWSGICLIAANSVNDTHDTSSALLFILGAPPFMYSWSLAVDLRMEWYKRTQDTPRDSPYMEEVRLRLKYPFVRMHNRREGLGSDMEFESDNSSESTCTESLLGYDDNDAVMEEYLSVATRFHRDGFFCLHVSLLMDRIWRHQVRSRKFLKLAESLPLSFDHLFVVYQKTLQNRERETGAKGAISYLAFDHHVKQAKIAMAESVDLIVKFWLTLMDGNYTVKDLHSLSVNVHRTLARCKLHMRSLLSLNPNSPTALTLYAVYHEYVLNDETMTKNILGTDDCICGEALINRLLKIEDVKESEFLVCGEGANLGRIRWASFGLLSMVEYTQAELFNSPLSILFVPSIADVMEIYLAKTVRNISTFAVIRVFTFCHSKSGNCTFVELALTPTISNAGELEFSCRFSEVAEEELLLRDELGRGYLLINLKGNVISGSADVWPIVGLSAEQVQNSKEHISNIVPWLRNEKSIRATQAAPKVGHAVELGDSTYHVDIVSHQLALPDKSTCFEATEIFQVKFTEMKGYSPLAAADGTVPPGKLRHMSSLRSDTFNSLISDTFGDDPFDMASSQASSDLGSEDDFDFDEEDLMKHIRKAIEQRINTSSPMVRRFVFQSRWLTLAVIVFFVAVSMFFDEHVNGYRDSLTYFRTVYERDSLLVNLASYTQDQVATIALFEESSRNNNNSGSSTVSDTDALQEMLQENANAINSTAFELRSAHRLLMRVSEADTSMRAFDLDFEADVSQNTSLVFHVGEEDAARASSIWIGILELTNHALAFSQYESPQCEDSCNFTLDNAIRSILPQSKKEARLWFQHQTAKLEEVSLFNWQVLIASSVAIVFLLIEVYLPVLLATSKSRKYTVHAFASIPSLLVLEMSDTYAKRAEHLVRLSEQSQADDADGVVVNKQQTSEQAAAQHKSLLGQQKDRQTFRFTPLKRAINTMGSSLRSIEKVANDHFLVRLIINLALVARIAYPSLLVWAMTLYFVLVPREAGLTTVQATADLVSQRWLASAELSFWLKEPPQEGIVKTIDDLLEIVSSVTYKLHLGNGSDTYEQLSDQQEEQWDLLFEDACLSRIASDLPCNKTLAFLGDFAEGVPDNVVVDLGLENGLHFANEQFISLVRDLRALYQQIAQNQTQGDIDMLLQQQAAMYRPSTLFESLLVAHRFSTDLAFEYVASLVDAFEQHRVGTSIAVCVIVIVSHLFVCRTVSAVDSDTQKNLILLMMLPEKVFKQRPQILDLLQVEHINAQ